jgi:hypothetical protein
MVEGCAARRWMNRSYRPQTVDQVATAPRRWTSDGIAPDRIIDPRPVSVHQRFHLTRFPKIFSPQHIFPSIFCQNDRAPAPSPAATG